MGKSRQHNQAKFEKAMALLEEGFLPKEIAKKLDIDPSTASRWAKKIEDRKFKTFQEADRLIKVESDLIIRVGTLLQMDLFNRSRRYIDDPWDW